MRNILFSCLAIATLSGCANPGIVKLSPDTYMLSRTDKAGVFGNASAMKADVIREASDFAASQGKVAIPLALNERPMVFGGGFASVEYQFRVVDSNDREVRRTSLMPRADVVIEKTEVISADVRTKDQSSKASKDTYTELIKLDDLRKKGILSEIEFEAQKKKILGAE
jgi:hypothetical protein